MRLVEYLRQGCNQFKLRFEEDYVAKLPGNVLLQSIGRIEDLGARNGMLIFSSSRQMWAYRKLLSEADFGFSVLSDPVVNNGFNVDSFKVMIIDWGWIEDKG